MVMLDLLPLPVDDHQPGVGPMPEWLLGNQVPGHLIIERERGLGHRVYC